MIGDLERRRSIAINLRRSRSASARHLDCRLMPSYLSMPLGSLNGLALTGSYAVARSAWATKNWRARRETPADRANSRKPS
jgi:hypothetical protein